MVTNLNSLQASKQYGKKVCILNAFSVYSLISARFRLVTKMLSND